MPLLDIARSLVLTLHPAVCILKESKRATPTKETDMIDTIRADIRTAYDLMITDPAASTQYARAARSAITEATLQGDTEAASLAWMVEDLI